MERYIVTIVSPQRQGRPKLLIPVNSDKLVSALLAEVIERSARAFNIVLDGHVTLRSGAEDGPVIDENDPLGDVVPDPSITVLFATSFGQTQPQPRENFGTFPSNGSNGGVKIRVITPALAYEHVDINDIPLLHGGITVPVNTTLWDIKLQISRSLALTLEPIPPRFPPECNCNFAHRIQDYGVKKSSHFIVVHDQSKVEWLFSESTDVQSVMNALEVRFGQVVVAVKSLQFMDKTEKSDSNEMMPVVAICSKARHPNPGVSDGAPTMSGSITRSHGPNSASGLDLHTSEGPLEIADPQLTLDESGLADCTVNGVLDLYAVLRTDNTSLDKRFGQTAIYKMAGFWEVPLRQSKRGVAAFLSSLRVFANLIKDDELAQNEQNAVLRIVHMLTRFPPALIAVHTLMESKTPHISQCAALVQSAFTILRAIIPLEIIQNDEKRVLEGSRLLFGLILAKAKQQVRESPVLRPYHSSFKEVGLVCAGTTLPVVRPSFTSMGLLEEGYYDAHREGGILSGCNEKLPPNPSPTDTWLRRQVLRSGGTMSKVTVLDMDLLNSSLKIKVDSLKFLGDVGDLHHLATLCEMNDLAVIPPLNLPTSEHPVLTLDRTSSLAVYVGREACGTPGKDIITFRPADGGDENVDVAVITQLIAPLLDNRARDGTDVFDNYGGSSKRRERCPDEIIMFCVDCSNSMNELSDFEEMKEGTMLDDHGAEEVIDDIQDGDYFSTESDTDDVGDEDFTGTGADDEGMSRGPMRGSGARTELNADAGLSFTELKEYLSKHECFEDILAIVQNTSTLNRQAHASRVIRHLIKTASRQLMTHKAGLQELQTWATTGYIATSSHSPSCIAGFENLVTSLTKFRQALCDYLVFSACIAQPLLPSWKWNIGDEIPKPIEYIPSSARTTLEDMFIPNEFVCPISQEVFEDPVITADGFTYERDSIKQWFDMRISSPSTGLPLDSDELRPNNNLAANINQWINGESILEAAPRPRKRARLNTATSPTVTLEFVGLQSFTREVPKHLTVADLYKLAFQGMKGGHINFELRSNDQALDPSATSIGNCGLGSGTEVEISAAASSRDSGIEDEIPGGMVRVEPKEMFLIKAYIEEAKPLFCFWAPRDRKLSFASVIWRYWRYNAEAGLGLRDCDVDAWSECRDVGDNEINGAMNRSWEKLSPNTTSKHGKGSLTAESLNESKGPSSTNIHVMKLYLLPYRSISKDERHDKKRGRTLSRLETSKHIFDTFVNRTLAYNLKSHIGLIVFDSSAKVRQGITHSIEDFRDSMNGMVAKGDTAVWDALALANDQMAEYGRKYPTAKRRIICLSDGIDTDSSHKSFDICEALVRSKVVVDSFCIGSVNDPDLRTVSYLTGGYKFLPRTLEQAMAICEMEPVLNQLERPRIKPISQVGGQQGFKFFTSKATPDIVTRDSFPARREHPNLGDIFIALSDFATSTRASAATARGRRSNINVRSARLLTEVNDVAASRHPSYDVFVSESDIGFWKIVMQGPSEGPYSSGTFLLYLHMENDYPGLPPKARFCTPIIHPNINRHDRVCHSILDRNWTADTSNSQILNMIYSLLLLVPEHSDSVDAMLTLNFHRDQVAFEKDVLEHIRKHASKSRQRLRYEILESHGHNVITEESSSSNERSSDEEESDDEEKREMLRWWYGE